MKNKILIFFVFLASQFNYAQLVPEMEWLRIYDGPGNGNDIVNDMKIDKNYNIYLAGRSEGTDGTTDFLIMEYSKTGDSLLNIRFISLQNAWDEANSIAVDSNENIYAIGSSTFDETSFYSIFFKYSPGGDVIWDKNNFSNSAGISEGLKVVLDNQENPIIGYIMYQQYSYVNFAKYKSNGDSLWTTQIKDDTSSYQLNYLLSDAFGNIYAALTQTYYNGGDVPDTRIILLKLNQDGNTTWYKSMQGNSPRKLIFDNDSNILLETNGRVLKYTQNGDSLWNYETTGLLTDAAADKDNNILVCGYTGGIGGFDYLVDKISSEGGKIWSKSFNSVEGLRDFASSLAVDNQNNVYVTGSSNDMISQGLCYTLKYNSAGELKWQYRFDAPHGIFENPQSIFLDDSNNVIIGGDYYDSTNGANYFVMKIKQNSGTGVQYSDNDISSRYFLSQNYPNPFNPSTTISFSIPRGQKAELSIYDLTGEKIITLLNEYKPAGKHSAVFDGSEFSSGVYFYQLKTDEFIQTKKLIILK